MGNFFHFFLCVDCVYVFYDQKMLVFYCYFAQKIIILGEVITSFFPKNWRIIAMKIALYCRVSTDNFNQDVSRQINELAEIATRQGWDVAETTVDDETG